MPQIVLVYPQIPPNTGNIARTCAATQTPLHVVGPIGFDISDRAVKRAGLDYWPYVDYRYHESFEAFQAVRKQRGGRQFGFSKAGQCNYLDLQFQPDDWLLFGSETDGLPENVLAQCDEVAYIPMPHGKVRSLNLSVSAALGLYEALRQLGKLT